MKNFLGCITEAADAGEIDADVAARSRRTYERAYAAAEGAFGPAEADRMAADAVMSDLERQALEAKRRKVLMVRSRREVLEGVAAFKASRGYEGVEALGAGGGDGGSGSWVQGGQAPGDGLGKGGGLFARALELLVENKPGLSGAPFSSVEDRYRAIRGQADALMASVIERFETRTGFDTPNRAELTNMVREAFGEASGDPAAKALAEAWDAAAERLRLMFNAAGGSIGKLDRWGLPQSHDVYAVRAVGRDAWVAEVLPRLDRARMLDGETNLPLGDVELIAALGDAWESIVSLGANKRAPGAPLGMGSVATRRSDARFLQFKSADDWMAYAKAFGDGDPFATMMGHLDELSRDIAQMQILGPNPDAGFTWLKQAAMREALLEEGAGVKGAADRAKGYIATADDMLESFKGTTSTPINSRLAGWGATSRAALTSFTLGSAIISDAASAPYFGVLARSYAGLSKRGDMGRFLSMLNPADPASRQIARRSGFIVEQATDGFIRATHDNLRLLTVGERVDGGLNALGRRLPAAVLRLQGLTSYNAARKRSFRFEFMGALHDRRDRTIAQLAAGDGEDQAFAQWLGARGFSEADWAMIRQAPVWRPAEGAEFLRPTDVPDETLALRLAGAIDLETRFAAPETTLWTRAKLLGSERPGTVMGEARRSWAMFRSFSLTATHLYAEEAAMRAQTRHGAGLAANAATAATLAGHVIFLTMAGAAAIQLREIAKGNDPKPMDRARFWGDATLQGGGFGVIGDFLFSAEKRNGANAEISAFGPGGQAVGDLYAATAGNALEVGGDVIDGAPVDEAMADARVGRDTSNLLRRYTPLSTLWWSRAAWNRAVVDNVQRSLDPDAEDDFARRRRRMERDQGVTSWWPQGENLPERAPDVGQALEPSPG